MKTVFFNPVSTRIIRKLRSRRVLTGVSAVALGTAGAAYGLVHRLTTVPTLPPPPANLQPVKAAAATAPFKAKHRFNPLRGIASWYGAVLHGHPTASGEIFDETKMTACHNSLPFGTRVRVTDMSSMRSVVVRINDRGVLSAGRVIDLSSGAAQKLGILRSGIAQVKLEVLKNTVAETADERPGT